MGEFIAKFGACVYLRKELRNCCFLWFFNELRNELFNHS